MASYKITLTVSGSNIKTVQKAAEKAFGRDAGAQVTKQTVISSRADRLGEAESEIENAKSTVEELKDELQNWYDNLPENLQQSTKAEEIQEAIDNLESISSDLENIDFSSVSFPGMY